MAEFEWDARKEEHNLRKHGVPFSYATRVFDDPQRRDHLDTRCEYGEERRIVVGMIEDRVYVVAYTWRHTRIRLISARKANDRESRAYHTLSA